MTIYVNWVFAALTTDFPFMWKKLSLLQYLSEMPQLGKEANMRPVWRLCLSYSYKNLCMWVLESEEENRAKICMLSLQQYFSHRVFTFALQTPTFLEICWRKVMAEMQCNNHFYFQLFYPAIPQLLSHSGREKLLLQYIFPPSFFVSHFAISTLAHLWKGLKGFILSLWLYS